MSIAHILPNPELAAPSTTLGIGGLRSADGRAFPLTSVKVRATVAGACARTVVEQHFANPFFDTLDVTWIFPLPDNGALVELELQAGDILVKGECQERSKARAVYDAARAAGNRAALLEKEQGDVHTLSLAGLPAGSHVTVRLTLVQLLPAIDGRFRWHFPTTIAPRYTPGVPWGHGGRGVDPDTDAVPNASRLTPPLRLAGGTQLDLEVEIAGPLSALECNLHAVTLPLDSGVTRIAPSGQATLNQDFVLQFSTAEEAAPVTRAWTDGHHTLVLIEPPSGGRAAGLPRDAVFTVDISGSMEGLKMDAAKTALRGALHGLRSGDRFKLIAFDERVERFSPDFATYDDLSLAAADGWVAALSARGGTDMLPAIQESLDGGTPAGRLRTVLFITDGQSNDEGRLLPAVAHRRGEALFFTLGIDTAVNAALLTSLARVGGGVCELCSPYDDIDAAVARLEARFGSPLLSGLTVAGAARPDGQTVFAGRPATLLLEGAPPTVDVSGFGPAGTFAASVVPVRIAFPLGALWAMERISWLEERLALRPFEEEAIRPEILRVALQWGLASKFTAFVCVDHSTVSGGDRRHVVQPTELPQGWTVSEATAAAGMYGSAGGTYMSAPPPSASPRGMPFGRSARHRASASPDVCSAALEGFFSAQGPAPAQSANSVSAAGPTATAVRKDVASFLAGSQGADGSFGGDVGRTAAALLALLLLGNTRRKGDRRRTVQKAAQWLLSHEGDERAGLALAALEAGETSGVVPTPSWRSLASAGAEGDRLALLLDARGV